MTDRKQLRGHQEGRSRRGSAEVSGSQECWNVLSDSQEGGVGAGPQYGTGNNRAPGGHNSGQQGLGVGGGGLGSSQVTYHMFAIKELYHHCTCNTMI